MKKNYNAPSIEVLVTKTILLSQSTLQFGDPTDDLQPNEAKSSFNCFNEDEDEE